MKEATINRQSEKLFEREVIVDTNFRVKLIRTVESDDDGVTTGEREAIVATVPPSTLFGDWRTNGPPTNPDPVKVAADCSEAIGFKIVIETIEREADGPIVIEFSRDQGDAAPEDNPTDEQEPEEDATGEEAKRDLAEIFHMRRRVSQSFQKAKNLKVAYDAAKKQWEAYRNELEEMIREVEEGANLPLLQKPAANGHAKEPAGTTDGPVNDAWKADPITRLKLTAPIVQKLQDANIHTMGEFQAHVNDLGSRGFTDPMAQIKGIGATTAEKIDLAWQEYWKEVLAAAQRQTASPDNPSVAIEANGETVETTLNDMKELAQSFVPDNGQHDNGRSGAKPVKAKGKKNKSADA